MFVIGIPSLPSVPAVLHFIRDGHQGALDHNILIAFDAHTPNRYTDFTIIINNNNVDISLTKLHNIMKLKQTTTTSKTT